MRTGKGRIGAKKERRGQVGNSSGFSSRSFKAKFSRINLNNSLNYWKVAFKVIIPNLYQRKMPSVDIKKVVIFGATGNTGLATVSEAILKGYEVTAFLRDPSKLPAEVKPTSVVQGDVLNQDDVDKAVQGQDGVIVALGTRNDLSATTVMSQGTKNIVEAMKKNGVKRISCCVSSFLFWERAKVPPQFIPLTEDHERMVEVLKGSDREWVAVFPPHISDEPARGNYKMVNDAPVNRVISKYDLAEILVKCLTTEEHVGHTVGIGYPAA